MPKRVRYVQMTKPAKVPENGPTGEEWSANKAAVLALTTAVLYDFDHGLKGDGITDDGPAFQAMLDSVPSGGAKLVMTKPWYYLGTGVTTSKIGLTIECAGVTGQDGNIGIAGTIFRVGPGVVGLTFGTDASTIFNGPLLRNMVFMAEEGALGGLQLLRTNNWRLENVIATGFDEIGAFGIRSDGTGNVNQYGTLVECGAHNCHKGWDFIRSNGIVALGGYLDGNSNGSGSPPVSPPGTGSIGIHTHGGGDTFKAFGTRVQFYDTGALLDDAGADELHGVRFEGCGTNIDIYADDVMVFGGSISNHISGSGGTGIHVRPGATRTVLMIPLISSVGTQINDEGTDTVILHNRELTLGGNSSIYWGADGEVYLWRSGSQLRTGSNLQTDATLIANNVRVADTIYIGPGNDHYWYQVTQGLRTDTPVMIGNTGEPATPSGGGVIYVEGGVLKYKGSSGTVTTLGPA